MRKVKTFVRKFVYVCLVFECMCKDDPSLTCYVWGRREGEIGRAHILQLHPQPLIQDCVCVRQDLYCPLFVIVMKCNSLDYNTYDF